MVDKKIKRRKSGKQEVRVMISLLTSLWFFSLLFLKHFLSFLKKNNNICSKSYIKFIINKKKYFYIKIRVTFNIYK